MLSQGRAEQETRLETESLRAGVVPGTGGERGRGSECIRPDREKPPRLCFRLAVSGSSSSDPPRPARSSLPEAASFPDDLLFGVFPGVLFAVREQAEQKRGVRFSFWP